MPPPQPDPFLGGETECNMFLLKNLQTSNDGIFQTDLAQYEHLNHKYLGMK